MERRSRSPLCRRGGSSGRPITREAQPCKAEQHHGPCRSFGDGWARGGKSGGPETRGGKAGKSHSIIERVELILNGARNRIVDEDRQESGRRIDVGSREGDDRKPLGVVVKDESSGNGIDGGGGI